MSAIDKYFKFDAIEFCKDYEKKKRQYKALSDRYEDMLELSGVNPVADKVDGGDTESAVEKTAIRREMFKAKMDDTEMYLRAYKRAIESLNEEERTVIQAFFQNGNTDALDALERDYGMSRTHAYLVRKAALDKIAFSVIVYS